jgi:hypothetical protein
MVTLNILLILLSFINSLNKGGKKVDVAQTSIGEVVLCGGPTTDPGGDEC